MKGRESEWDNSRSRSAVKFGFFCQVASAAPCSVWTIDRSHTWIKCPVVRMGFAAVTKPSNLKGLKQQRFVSHSYHIPSELTGILRSLNGHTLGHLGREFWPL